MHFEETAPSRGTTRFEISEDSFGSREIGFLPFSRALRSRRFVFRLCCFIEEQLRRVLGVFGKIEIGY